MEWFWYTAKPNELFLDVDRFSKSVSHIRQRLQGAIESEILPVKQVHKFDSLTNDHAHIIIELEYALSHVETYAWEIVLHSDIYRGCCNLMRYMHGIKHPDILIGTRMYHRPPDVVCICEKKHIRKVMEVCPAAELLRGHNKTAAFFGKPSDNPCEWL